MEANDEIKLKSKTKKESKVGSAFIGIVISLILLSVILLIVQYQMLPNIYVDKDFREGVKVR